ncbi:MAG: SLC13 family permease [Cyclobacteriaceae bacterium]
MEQILVFAVLGLSLIFFVWGKLRYDLVALLALIVLSVFGLIPYENAFMGFSHPAVITVAAVLVVSKSLEKSGLVNYFLRFLDHLGSNITIQITGICALVALASGFMNNIGALAIFMPVAIQMARKHHYSPSLVLMPIAFASLLGGMVTLIGTPPNIIISAFRSGVSGNNFSMFDFAPVGIGITLAGVVFISLVGWRFLPRRKSASSEDSMFEINNYITEVIINPTSPLIGKTLQDIGNEVDLDFKVLGIVRDKQRIHAPGPFIALRENDILILESNTEVLEKFIDQYQTKLVGNEDLYNEPEAKDEIIIMEGIVLENSPLVGQTAASIHMRSRYDVNLLALARSNKTILQRIDHVIFETGDVLMLQGRSKEMADIFNDMQCYPLAQRSLSIGKPKKTIFAISLFVASILVVVAGWMPVEMAFTLAAVMMVIIKVMPLKDLYTSIDWPVIVLLGAMIPVGEAFETSGAAASVTENILIFSDILPSWTILIVIMVTTMLLSSVINNAATVVLMAPIGLKIAESMELSTDPFLMTIAIGASSAFLTPIGHQSNTLVMGPGGYKFSDYWKLGLPLTILVLAVGIPLILIFWPL